MPAGAKGLSPGPSARRFFWSIGDEEDDGEGRRTIVCTKRWIWGWQIQRKVKKAELGIMLLSLLGSGYGFRFLADEHEREEQTLARNRKKSKANSPPLHPFFYPPLAGF